MDLSVITVTWNSAQHVLEHFNTFFCEQNPVMDLKFEYLLVDNASSDGTVSKVKRHFPQVNIFENTANLGFSAANNQGFSKARGRFILFLNPDTDISLLEVKHMILWMEAHPDVALIGPRFDDRDGRPIFAALPRRFPKIFDQIIILLKIQRIFPRLIDHYLMTDMDPYAEQKVDSLRGACLLVKKSFLDSLGYAFDQRYFIWFEDVDLCMEAKKRNLKVMYTPQFGAYERLSQSFLQQNMFWKHQNFSKSMLLFFQKWHPWYVWIWIAALRPVSLVWAWMLSSLVQLKNRI
ncbi:MAG: glycosyltransferase family 2 protein [Parcubacteria group bacterium]|nr:glycosyltransferase family 2 protein [Parcubacteria group bacterium]